MIDDDVGATTEQIDRQAPFGDRVLLVIDGASLQVVPLPGTGTLTVGRSQKCDVSIDSGSVSRHHANLVVGEGGTLSFSRTGTTVEADGGRSILDTAEEAGVLMPSGCRMGICMGCVLPLREGAVRDLRNGEITTASAAESDRGGVMIQTCINAAAGACDIDH